MLQAPDLLISGGHPLIWLLALITARSGLRVSVYETPLQALCWRIAESPFDWFGEPTPDWSVTILHEYFSGLAVFDLEGCPELYAWRVAEPALWQMCRQMRQDAFTWGAQACAEQQWLPFSQQAALVISLDPMLFEGGFWIWQTQSVLSPPGICEIIPPFYLSSHVGQGSLLAISGVALRPPERPDFWPESLPCPEPVFYPHSASWSVCQISEHKLCLPMDLAWVLPKHTLQQALFMLWIRYAGRQLAQSGVRAAGIIERLSDYWGKLITGTEYARQKFIFLR